MKENMRRRMSQNKRGESKQTPKEEVIELFKKLPDNSSLEEIQYHLYVRQKIQRGMKDVEEGRIYTEAEMEERMKEWSVE